MTKFGLVFLAMLAVAALVGLAQPVPHAAAGMEGPAERNQRLTALTGIVLLVLLAALAVTVLDVPRFLAAHYVIGFLLLPPLILKLASTGYRFVRYYSGSEPFRRAGAPPLILRFLVAPVLVVATAAVFVTGLELWLFGLRFGSVWISAHTLSAVVMVAAVAAHLLAHSRLSAEVLVDAVAARQQAVFAARSLAIASLVFGVVLAAASLLYASPFTTTIAGG